jgi:hypothetical protein
MSTDVIAALIQEVAALTEESERLCKPLQGRLEKVRSLLKDAMADADTLEAIDETSGYRAYIKETHSDHWVAEKLVPLLGRPELIDECIVTTVDPAAVKRLIDDGTLTRSRLEQEGALVRTLRARALYLEPLKGARP